MAQQPQPNERRPARFLKIDEEGFLLSEGIRWTDAELCGPILRSLRVEANGSLMCSLPEQQNAPAMDVQVEVFDAPIVARQFDLDSGVWTITAPYLQRYPFSPSSLTVDEWDRFHGITNDGIPFVFSREAQNQLFNTAEEFEDEGVKIQGEFYPIKPYFTRSGEVTKPDFWNQNYTSKNLPWELPGVHPAIIQTFKQMKFNRSRIAVLGSGGGHDAAWLAQNGHIVTGFDFSPSAVELARQRYGSVQQLQFVQADALKLDPKWEHRFDIVLDHTCFCAVQPQSRPQLTRTWRRLLAPEGHLVAICFIIERRSGPPYGASEWELRQRLKAHYNFLYWSRWEMPEPAARLGTELVIVAQAKP